MEILRKVLKKVFPEEEEWKEVLNFCKRVISSALRICSSSPYSPSPHIVGSAIRRTFIKGDHDVDLFLVYPREADEKRALEDFLILGKRIYEDLGGSWELKYAQHPYYRGRVEEDFTLEIVLSFKFEKGEKVKSPVDRSVEHDRFLKRKLLENKGLRKEIVLMKAFLKGIGAYGAESYVGGFSGYLTELLTVYYGSFLNALKEISKWRPYKVLLYFDAPGKWRKGLAPLIFVDPVDENRNVAAAVREDKVRLLILASRDFLRSPDERFFFPRDPPPLNQTEIEELEKRSFLIRFPEEFLKIHEEIRYSELDKTARGLSSSLKLEDVEIKKYLVLWKRGAILFIYHDKRKIIERKIGPPALPNFEKAIERFLSKWRKDPRYVREGISGGRVYVEIRRDVLPLPSLIAKCLKRCKKGKDLCQYVEKEEYEILMGREVVDFVKMDKESEKMVKLFLSEIPPWKF